MPVNVTNEIVIDRPINQVAAYAGDLSNAPNWYANVAEVEWQVRGSRLAFVGYAMGRRIAYTYQVTEVVPGQRLVMRTSEGPFPNETTYAWTPVGPNATKMTLHNVGSKKGVAKLVPFSRSGLKRANKKNLAKLKSILER